MTAEGSPYRIRPATSADGGGVRALVGDVLAEFGFTLDTRGTDADLDDLMASYVGRGGIFDVIEGAAGEIIGCAGIYPIDTPPGSARTCELRKMYLRPACRGTGLGRQLLDRMVAGARRCGFSEIRLETASNLTDAIGLYQRNGFVEYDVDNRTSRCDRTFRLDLTGDTR